MSFLKGKTRAGLLEHLDDGADMLFVKGKKNLHHVARVCLLLAYFQDGYFRIRHFEGYSLHLAETSNIPTIMGYIIMGLSVCTLLIPSVLILFRKHILFSSICLAIHTCFQSYLYWTLSFWYRSVLRSISVFGGLLLLVSEGYKDTKGLFAGVPISESYKSSESLLKFTGRSLLLLDLATDLSFDGHILQVLVSLVTIVAMVLIFVGWKTRLVTLILSGILTINNFYQNAFWFETEMLYYYRYMFFRAFSVIGGMLLITLLGPGAASLDGKLHRN